MVKTTKVCNDKIDEIVSYKELIFSGVFQSREAVTKTKLKTRLIIDVQSLLAMKKSQGRTLSCPLTTILVRSAGDSTKAIPCPAGIVIQFLEIRVIIVFHVISNGSSLSHNDKDKRQARNNKECP